MFDRHMNSGYMDGDASTETAVDLYRAKQQNVVNEAREELGLLGRPLTPDEQDAVETRLQLKRKEGRIASKREKKQYYDVRSSLKTDRERLNFLSIPSFEGRQRYANSRGLGNQSETYSSDVARVIEASDITLGMSQKAVMQSWGDPDAVEVSGNPIFGNERWKYNRYISGNEGYQKELRIVYFEGGHVIGWERPH
jgi:hypothetical protein